MTPAEQVAAARAEIARRRAYAEAAQVENSLTAIAEDKLRIQSDVVLDFIDDNEPTHVLGVLADADATLNLHKKDWRGYCDRCGEIREWPCLDARAVINRYMPQDPA